MRLGYKPKERTLTSWQEGLRKMAEEEPPLVKERLLIQKMAPVVERVEREERQRRQRNVTPDQSAMMRYDCSVP